jgi:AdoMet-dependent rRNA methyltransferase SPB1
VALAALDKLPETTEEIRNCCGDLKVLGRKEFKLLLKWRLKVREIFGFPTKKMTQETAEEVAEVEPMDEELQIQEDLQKMKEKETSKKKRERRRENEKKQKEIVRMQMNMTAPMDIGMEQEGPRGEGAMFRLKGIDQTPALSRIAKGKMIVVKDAPKKDHDSGLGSSGETDDDSDEDGDRLETELDALYDQYRERKMEADAKYRAKKARQEHDDDEWEGVSADEKADSDDEELEGFEESSDEDDSEPDESKSASKSLLQDLDDAPSETNGLSKRAAKFFEQGIFQDIEGLLEFSEEEGNEDEEMAEAEPTPKPAPKPQETKSEAKSKSAKTKAKATPKGEEEDYGFEVVKKNEDDDWEEAEKRTKDGRPSKSTTSSTLTIRLILTTP